MLVYQIILIACIIYEQNYGFRIPILSILNHCVNIVIKKTSMAQYQLSQNSDSA